jgi:hypothetical protein
MTLENLTKNSLANRTHLDYVKEDISNEFTTGVMLVACNKRQLRHLHVANDHDTHARAGPKVGKNKNRENFFYLLEEHTFGHLV